MFGVRQEQFGLQATVIKVVMVTAASKEPEHTLLCLPQEAQA